MNISEQQLRSLAKNNPKELAKLLNNPNTDIHTLTFGAEFLGDAILDEELASTTFIQLLKHINAVVREGALIGVSSFYMGKTLPANIHSKLQMMANHDPSPTVKDSSMMILRDLTY